MSTIIDVILKVGETIFGLRGQLSAAKQVRKQQVADFLAALAQTIEDTSASLKQGNYPSGKCQELLSHSQSMEAAIGDLVGPVQARELGQHLRDVWQIERLHAELSGVGEGERNRQLTVIDQAAGLFRATAAFVRVSP